MDISLLHMPTPDEADTPECHRSDSSMMAPEAVFLTIQVQHLLPQTASVLKQEMLAAGGEAVIPAGTLHPETLCVDCLVMGTLAQYRRLVVSLRERSFELSSLAVDLQTFTELSAQKPPQRQFDSPARVVIGGLVDCDRTVPGNSDRRDNAIGHAWNLLEERADFLIMAGSDQSTVTGIVQELAQSASRPVCAWVPGQTIAPSRPGFPLILQRQPDLPKPATTEAPISGPVLAFPPAQAEIPFLTELLQAGIPSSQLFITAVLRDRTFRPSDLLRLPRFDAAVLLQEDLAHFSAETRASIVTRLVDHGVRVLITNIPSQLRSLLEASQNDPWNC